MTAQMCRDQNTEAKGDNDIRSSKFSGGLGNIVDFCLSLILRVIYPLFKPRSPSIESHYVL